MPVERRQSSVLRRVLPTVGFESAQADRAIARMNSSGVPTAAQGTTIEIGIEVERVDSLLFPLTVPLFMKAVFACATSSMLLGHRNSEESVFGAYSACELNARVQPEVL